MEAIFSTSQSSFIARVRRQGGGATNDSCAYRRQRRSDRVSSTSQRMDETKNGRTPARIERTNGPLING